VDVLITEPRALVGNIPDPHPQRGLILRHATLVPGGS